MISAPISNKMIRRTAGSVEVWWKVATEFIVMIAKLQQLESDHHANKIMHMYLQPWLENI